MKRLMLSALALIALLVVGNGLLRSHVLVNSRLETTGVELSGSQGSQGAIRTESLPVEDFDDRSLVFPRETKQ
jgi:hypothetical protein